MAVRRIWGLCLLLVACAPDAPLPDMQPGETGRVTQVIDGDGLVLDTGQRVRLISVMAPILSHRDGPAESYAGESARLLEDLSLGRRVRLYYPGLTRDRYDRALAHVVTIDSAGDPLWLNYEMIVRGGARVRLYGSTAARGQDLLAAETEARSAQRGIWAEADYVVQDAVHVALDDNRFTLVTGILGARTEARDASPYKAACWRQFEASDLVLKIDQDARSACGMAAGTPVEVRGWVSDGTLALRHPLHLRILTQD